MPLTKSYLQKQVADHVITYKENYYRLAFSYVKNPEDALDIVQESIYKAISSIESLKDPQHIKTWFYRITVNTSLDFLRKQKRIILLEEEVLLNLESEETVDAQHIDIENALNELPIDYRTIVILRYFEDLKFEEIAEILDKNLNTVKTQLYKSLKKLRIKMEEV